MMVMDAKALKETVEFVRKTFFPRWHKEGRWTFQLNPKAKQESGRCIDEGKLIWISPFENDPIAVLIHEICHAVCPNHSHGSRWQRRMLKAAQRAQDIGNPKPAKSLREEVEQYRHQQEIVTKRGMYIEIEDIIWESTEKTPTYAAIRENLCYNYGLDFQEFERLYPEAERVYKREVAEKQNTFDSATR
jgi:hypothetical protein